MSPKAKKAKAGDPLFAGPWVAVVDADDPDAGDSDTLYDAVNCSPPDTGRASAYVARPGVQIMNEGAPLAAKVKAMLRHVRSAGTIVQYVVANGRLYQVNSPLTSYSVTDVTPSNVAISSGTNVFLSSFADKVIVNDQYHAPWAFNPEDNTGTFISWATPSVHLSIGTGSDLKVKYTSVRIPVAELGNHIGFSGEATLPAGTLPANRWAGFHVDVGVLSGTVTSAAANFTTGYATEAEAIAAIPNTLAVADGGYFTVQSQAGSAWVSGTHSLAGGATTPALTTNYFAPAYENWMAKGKPTVYGTKLFFILYTLPTIRSGKAITWSEEGDETTGYGQTNYDNTWELTQTSEDALNAIHGTESGLYCFRARSILRITGVVDATFRTNSTLDDILTVGCATNGTVEQVEQDLWFPDAEWRPRMMPIGGAVVDIYEDMRRTADSQYATALAASFITSPTHRPHVTYWPSTKLVLFHLWDGVTLYAFDAQSRRYVGRMLLGISSGVFIDALGVFYDSDRTPVLYVSGAQASGSSGATGGYVWREKRPDESSRWLDATSTVPTRSVTPRYPSASDQEFRFDPVTVVSMSQAPMTIQHTTTRAIGSTSSAVTPATSQTGTYRAQWGTQAFGRGVRVVITPTTATDQWGVARVQVGVTPIGKSPGAP